MDLLVTLHKQFQPEQLRNSFETDRKHEEEAGENALLHSRKQECKLDLKEVVCKGTSGHTQDTGTSFEHENSPTPILLCTRTN